MDILIGCLTKEVLNIWKHIVLLVNSIVEFVVIIAKNSSLMSAVAALGSVAVAIMTYRMNKQATKNARDNDYLYSLIQLVAVYNKTQEAYLSNTSDRFVLENIKKLDKQKIFDECEKAFYNKHFPQEFLCQFIYMVALISSWKSCNPKTHVELLEDYIKATRILKYSYTILYQSYKGEQHKIRYIIMNMINTRKSEKPSQYIAELEEVVLDYRVVSNSFDRLFERAVNWLKLKRKYEIDGQKKNALKDEVAKKMGKDIADRSLDFGNYRHLNIEDIEGQDDVIVIYKYIANNILEGGDYQKLKNEDRENLEL